jgi:hypothetical protein
MDFCLRTARFLTFLMDAYFGLVAGQMLFGMLSIGGIGQLIDGVLVTQVSTFVGSAILSLRQRLATLASSFQG